MKFKLEAKIRDLEHWLATFPTAPERSLIEADLAKVKQELADLPPDDWPIEGDTLDLRAHEFNFNK
jgi:hypothetical protein